MHWLRNMHPPAGNEDGTKEEKEALQGLLLLPPGRPKGRRGHNPTRDNAERVWKLILVAVLAVSSRIKKELKERVEILSVGLEKASDLAFYLFSWPWP